MRFRACGLSDVGRSRNHNEDHFEIVGDGRLCVVADGMGGHGHGDLASQIAVEAILESVGGSVPTSADDPAERSRLVEGAINDAHRKLLARVAADEELLGMGTTMVVMLVDDGRAQRTEHLRHRALPRADAARESDDAGHGHGA